ncbi:MAG TPA: polymer-forming cytoskeletal protein, partial [Gemmatimonadota bacterium]|nr:polymer-forming cytoskeletal protein [Gemmatimonadota bacterium]
MRRTDRHIDRDGSALGGSARVALRAAAATLCVLAASPTVAPAQEAAPASTSVTMSYRGAALQIEEADGATHRVALEDGTIRIDGQSVGSYERGSALETSWRDLLQQGMSQRPDAFAESLRAWSPPSGGASGTAIGTLRDALRRFASGGAAAGAGQAAGPTSPGPEAAGPEAAGPAAGGAAQGTVSVQAPGGGELTIAPGNLSVDQLTSRLERLKIALGKIGSGVQADASDLALVVHGDYEIPKGKVVGGNLALLSGDLRLGGEVQGDVLVLDGDLSLEPTAVVHGDVVQVGGDVERHGGRVDGEFLSVQGLGDLSVEPSVRSAPEVPSVPRIRHGRDRGFFGSIVHNVVSTTAGLMGVLTALVLLGVVGALTVYFLHEPFEMVSDAARASFGRSFGVGLAAEFLFFPVLLILVAGVITWLVIPFYLLAFGLALLAGYLAVA